MRKGTIFWGVIIILIGAVLLINNFVEVDIGRLILPLLMIVLGVWVLWGVFAGPRSFETEEASIPLEGAQQARVRIRHGAGRLQVAAGAGSGTLASGTFGGGLEQRVTRQGDALEVEMHIRNSGSAFASPRWLNECRITCFVSHLRANHFEFFTSFVSAELPSTTSSGSIWINPTTEFEFSAGPASGACSSVFMAGFQSKRSQYQKSTRMSSVHFLPKGSKVLAGT